ncbi:MAG TPA: DUF6603 domain-containing protein [Pyrinomonadaceae bacterium]|nr:DUF6603 domain-containing protein [Pyrinomonadaceae bacterium]
MADPTTSVIQLAAWLARSVGGSAALFADFTSEWLGLRLPDAVFQSPQVESALRGAETTATKVGAAGEKLETEAASGDEIKILSAFLQLGVALVEFTAALDNLATRVKANVTTATVPDPAARAEAEDFAEDLAAILTQAILASAVTDQAPRVGFALRLLGLLDWERVPRDPANPLSHDHVRRILRLNRVEGLITDPVQHYKDVFRWGEDDFNPASVFDLYSSFWDEEFGVETGVSGGDPFLRQGFLTIARDRATSPPSLALTATAQLEEKLETRIPVNDNWGFGVSSSLLLIGLLTGRVSPPLTFSLSPPSGSITGELRAFYNRNPEASPFDILGGVGLLSISAEDVKFGVGAKASWDGATTATIQPILFADVTGATLRLGTGDGDSFIGSLLASAEIEGEFDLGLEWTLGEGLRVKASGGVEIALPIHRELGPITLETLYFLLKIANDGMLSFETSAAITGKLGPLSASVDRIGAQLDLRFAEGADADFGPFDVALKFKPPNGIGLAVDAGVVKGGGYLYLDFDKGEYAGALELTFSNFLSLKAIGLINTKMPGGQPGFSLLIIITAEFSPGFQLGFGFVLAGVGGLLGLNRAVLLDALAQGVRTGAANNILFPTNVVENAPKIISDLKAIFPPEQGVFLIGPMAKIGWGTPTLISLSLGIIIEIPGNIVILGRLRVNLPTEDSPLVLLQVTFMGAIEFDKRRIWFFASLFESRVLFITLDGEMGLLMDFSDNPNFVLSVGGFHPSYSAPPLPFPSPKRIALNLINESYARVRVEGYFAVTTNSVQFGSRTEVFFGFDVLSVEGHISFDALFRFSPLYFIIEMSSGFSVKVFGLGLFSVRLRGSLEGPAPWRIRGTASISLLFFDIDVDVDETFGERNVDTIAPISVLPLLTAEIEKPANWVAGLPSSGQLFTNLRKLDAAAALVLHPVGTLKLGQRAVPLNLKIDKVGNQKAADVNELKLEVTSAGLTAAGRTRESFARAQFQDMDDARKLSSPSFEKLDNGVELSAAAGQWAAGPAADRNVRYETIILDTALEPLRVRFFEFWASLFSHFQKGAAVSYAHNSLAREKLTQPFADKVELPGASYVVAFTSDNKSVGQASVFGSQAEAEMYSAQLVGQDPTLFDSLHVIPATEVNTSL